MDKNKNRIVNREITTSRNVLLLIFNITLHLYSLTQPPSSAAGLILG